MESSEKNILVSLTAGTANWVPAPDNDAFHDGVLAVMRDHGIASIDTARTYGNGASETVLGNKGVASEFTITTKAPTGRAKHSAERAKILQGAKQSLETLKVEKVSIYLLHGPDDATPVADTYSAIQALYEEGRFDKFGLSNFSKEEVLEYYNYAKTNNFVLPTVYQSTYSIALRLNETLLFPTLRSLGMSIQAYSPLAGGFLTRTPADIEDGKGRWDPATPSGRIQRGVFYKPSYLKMLSEWGTLAEKSGAGRVGLACRWLRYHSLLKGNLGDQIIIGASSAEQFRQTVEEMEKGELPDWVVEKIEGFWDMVKDVAEVDNLRVYRELFG